MGGWLVLPLASLLLLASPESHCSPCYCCGFPQSCCCCCSDLTISPSSLVSCGISPPPSSTSLWGSKPPSSPQASRGCPASQEPGVLPPENVGGKSQVLEVGVRAQRPQEALPGSFYLPRPPPTGSAGIEGFQGLLVQLPLWMRRNQAQSLLGQGRLRGFWLSARWRGEEGRKNCWKPHWTRWRRRRR